MEHTIYHYDKMVLRSKSARVSETPVTETQFFEQHNKYFGMQNREAFELVKNQVDPKWCEKKNGGGINKFIQKNILDDSKIAKQAIKFTMGVACVGDLEI